MCVCVCVFPYLHAKNILQVNGFGCRAVYPTNLTTLDPLRPMRPLRVHDCLVDYQYVETIHAGVQCGFAVSIAGHCLVCFTGFQGVGCSPNNGAKGISEV